MTKQKENEFVEATGNFFKFEKIGDELVGTYISKEDLPAKGIYGAQIGYHFLVDGVEMTAAFGMNKKWVHSAMAQAKVGQRIKIVFDSLFETDAYKKELERVKELGKGPEDCKIAPAKTYKVFLGNMDTEYRDGFKDDVDMLNALDGNN